MQLWQMDVMGEARHLPLASAEQRSRTEVLRPSDGPDPGLTSRGHHRPVPGLPSRPR